jgi:hypothetical protein
VHFLPFVLSALKNRGFIQNFGILRQALPDRASSIRFIPCVSNFLLCDLPTA